MTTEAFFGRALFGIAALAAISACSPGTDPAHTAESITKAVYANDFDATTANFDDATKRSVTRADLGVLSDKMHALGDFQSLTQRSADSDSGRYAFDARFSNGAMLVEMRVDPSGKIGAYRISPEAKPTG